MKIKNWLRYLAYSVVIITLLILRTYALERYDAYRSREFEINFGLAAIGVIINITIGLVLGAEHLFNEIKKEGTWKINLPKVILIGLPSLCLSLIFWGMYADISGLGYMWEHSIISLLINYPGNQLMFQVIVGYAVISSFYKYTK